MIKEREMEVLSKNLVEFNRRWGSLERDMEKKSRRFCGYNHKGQWVKMVNSKISSFLENIDFNGKRERGGNKRRNL